MLLRSLLFVPANRERFVAKLATLRPDAVILDLEDSVPTGEKEAARALVQPTLERLPKGAFVRLVRLNPLQSGLGREDIRTVVGPGLDGVVLPKVESPEHLREANMLLAQAEVRAGLEVGSVRLIPLMETVRAVLRAEALAEVGPRLVAIAFGAEDYIRELGGIRTREGMEVLHARSHVVLTARAAGMEAIDTPWTYLDDLDGLWQDARLGRQLGFTGKLCIHPSQIEPVNRAFSPTAEEIEAARRVIAEADRAAERGHGSLALEGQMVDAPMAARARQMLARAQAIREAGP